MFRIFYIVSITFFTSSLCAQSNLKITFNDDFNKKNLMFTFIDGYVTKVLSPVFKNNTVLIYEGIKSKYARLIISYRDSLGPINGLCILFNRKKAFMKFKKVRNGERLDLQQYESENIINVNNSNNYKKLNAYTKSELEAFRKSSKLNYELNTDSSAKLQLTTYETLALKQIEFIKKNGNDYFYFEMFINDLVQTMRDKHLLQLYEIFNASFPTSFINSYEGKAAKIILEGNLFIKIGMPCPKFEVCSISGDTLNNERLKGKYYLLNFWATWCAPCVAEIPQLKEINAKYASGNFEMISISCDNDSLAFINGVKNYDLKWQNVFKSYYMEKLFGEKPIPSVYLINDKGVLIFSSWEKNLSELNELLKNELF